MTLTEITEYLLNEDNKLKNLISKSQSLFACLTVQLIELQASLKGKIQAKVDDIIETGKQLVLEHEESLLWIR